MIPDLSSIPPLYLVLPALVALTLLARRVPFLRVVVSLVTWLGLIAVVYLAIDQRGRFDPYLSELAGKLDLDRQKVEGGEVRIRMARDGHFWVHADIDGVERRLLVDSGATITALSATTAAAAGLKVRDELFPVVIRTANGSISAKTGTIGHLELGNISARDLAVVVSPAFGDVDILGMNFLSRLKSWRVEGQTLVLVPHHPQAKIADRG
jgi:aspartyl protease family protein